MDRNASFGQRRSNQDFSNRTSNAPKHAVRGTGDGGVEISWLPNANDDARHAAEDALENKRAAEAKGKRKVAGEKLEKRQGVQSFGAGMERGGDERNRHVSETDRRGRTERRKGMRSGSRNTIFARK